MIRPIISVMLILILSIAIPCVAQTNAQPDTTLARQHYEKATLFSSDQQYDSALFYFEIAEKIYKKGSYYALYVDCITQKGKVLNTTGQYEVAHQIIQQALALSKQQLGLEHLQTARAHDQLGWNQFYTSKYDEALQNYSTSLDIFTALKGDYDAEIAKMNINIGNVYRRKYMPEKAIAYTLKGVDMLSSLGQDTSQFAAAAYNGLGATYASMEVFDKALEYHQKALPLYKSAFGENHSNVAGSYFNIGNIYADRGDNATALEYYFKALRIDIHLFGEKHAYVAGDYESIGICYFQKGETEMARTYFQKSLDIAIAAFGEKNLHSAALINHIGATYHNQQNYEQALAYYQKSLPILKAAGKDSSPQIASLYNNLGNTSLKLGQGEQALQYQQEALKIYMSLADVWQSRLGETYGYMGSCYEEMQDYGKALEYYQKDLEVRIQTVGLSHPEVAYVYANIGGIHRKTQHYSASLRAYQQALQVLYAPLDTQDIYQNPPIDQTLNPYILYEILNAKALAFREYVEKGSGTVEDLRFALETYQLAANTLQETRKSLMTATSKNMLAEKSVQNFEDALETASLLYERTGEKEYIRQAFMLAEKSKAVALLEALKESEAREFANIPAAVLSEERDLKVDLAFNKRKLFEAQQTPQDSSVQAYQDKIFVLKNSYDSLISVMEKEYPEYYRLKYNPAITSVEQVQQALQKQEALLSYFVGDSSMYTFVINAEHAAFFRTKKDSSYDRSIAEVRKVIADKTNNVEGFVKSAQMLYNSLLASAEPLIQGKKLIIVPDGMLSYLPFGVLLKPTSESHVTGFYHLPYFIQEHQITYNYSATLWHESLKPGTPHFNAQFLAFAPSFNQQKTTTSDDVQATALLASANAGRGSLAALEGTRDEVNAIAAHFEGQFYEGAVASEELFKQQASNFDIIHLATHAIIDDMHPMNSRLLFSLHEDTITNGGSPNESDQDGNLYAWELYNMQLNARMAVLSACNTGFGKLQRGEGVMSLGRAFAYAGCPSIIMSMWPAQDHATAAIMIDFYQGLSEGMSKDEALQKAKLKYLDTTNELFAHPFYWASFVVQGDPAPLSIQQYKFSYWWLAGGFALLLLCFALFYHFRK